MKIDEHQHPDQLNDWHTFKAITNGSKQALDDNAIAAYFYVLNNGGALEDAQAAFFKVYNNENYK